MPVRRLMSLIGQEYFRPAIAIQVMCGNSLTVVCRQQESPLDVQAFGGSVIHDGVDRARNDQIVTRIIVELCRQQRLHAPTAIRINLGRRRQLQVVTAQFLATLDGKAAVPVIEINECTLLLLVEIDERQILRAIAIPVAQGHVCCTDRGNRGPPRWVVPVGISQ